jgi:ribonuclease VapC
VTVVDSSAVVAILRNEPDAPRFAKALEQSEWPIMSAGTLLELGIVALRREGAPLVNDLFELMSVSRIEVISVSEGQARTAIEAYGRFGRGSGHPARLNYGDCFSYALAKARNLPLLYKGDDFARTDIRSAL